jgi:hypothetical protein
MKIKAEDVIYHPLYSIIFLYIYTVYIFNYNGLGLLASFGSALASETLDPLQVRKKEIDPSHGLYQQMSSRKSKI